MGLNLNISRIIFSTLQKYDGTATRDLTVSEIKQIAGIFQQKYQLKLQEWYVLSNVLMVLLGRAGRFQSKFPIGEVTCLHKEDLPLLHASLKSPSPLLEVIL